MIECGTLQDPCRHGKRACTLVYTRRAFARRVRTASLRLSVTTYKSYIVGGMGRDHLNKHVPVTMCGLALGGCACVVALGRPSRRAGAHGVWGVITTLNQNLLWASPEKRIGIGDQSPKQDFDSRFLTA